jgi:hypothetical protein
MNKDSVNRNNLHEFLEGCSASQLSRILYHVFHIKTLDPKTILKNDIKIFVNRNIDSIQKINAYLNENRKDRIFYLSQIVYVNTPGIKCFARIIKINSRSYNLETIESKPKLIYNTTEFSLKTLEELIGARGYCYYSSSKLNGKVGKVINQSIQFIPDGSSNPIHLGYKSLFLENL